jgi:hypothetical protein
MDVNQAKLDILTSEYNSKMFTGMFHKVCVKECPPALNTDDLKNKYLTREYKWEGTRNKDLFSNWQSFAEKSAADPNFNSLDLFKNKALSYEVCPYPEKYCIPVGGVGSVVVMEKYCVPEFRKSDPQSEFKMVKNTSPNEFVDKTSNFGKSFPLLIYPNTRFWGLFG